LPLLYLVYEVKKVQDSESDSDSESESTDFVISQQASSKEANEEKDPEPDTNFNLGESLNYLETLENVAKEGKIDNEEERTMFLENVLTEVEGHEVDFFFNGKSSNSLEVILEFAQEQQVRELMNKLEGKWVALCSNRSSSHPVQVLLKRVAEKLSRGYEDTDMKLEPDELPTLQQLFLTVCSEFKGNLWQLSMGAYGSFVLRNVLHILSGVETLDEKHGQKNKRSRIKRKWKLKRTKEIPELFTKLLSEWAKEFKESRAQDFQRMGYNQHAVPVMACFLECLNAVGLQEFCDSLICKILQWKNTDGEYSSNKDSKTFVAQLLVDNSASHLLEKVCTCSSEIIAQKIFNLHFKGNLTKLATHRCGNYCVQKILLRLSRQEDVNAAFEELFPSFKQLFHNFPGVIWALAEACAQINGHFEKLLTALRGQLDVKKTENLFRKLVLKKGDKSYYLLNCLIFKSLISFRVYEVTELLHGVIKFAESQIVELCTNNLLSRIFDQAVKCWAKKRARKKLIKLILPHFDTIIKNEFGSYSIQNAFWSADPKVKKLFAEALAKSWNRYSGSKFGAKVLEVLQIDVYREDAGKWNGNIKKIEKEMRKISVKDLVE